MNSAEIHQLLTSVREANISDDGTLQILQKIRSEAMATRGGLQRLVTQGCAHYVLKLLYRYVLLDQVDRDKDKASDEAKVSLALSILANLLVDQKAKQQVKKDGLETIVSLLTECTSEEILTRCCRSLSNLMKDPSQCLLIIQCKAIPALVKVLEIRFVSVSQKDEKLETTNSGNNSKEAGCFTDKIRSTQTTDTDEDELEAKFPSAMLVDSACRVLRYMMEEQKARQQMLEAGVVMTLSMLVKSDVPVIVSHVVRALSSLWISMKKKITEKMANDLSRAGIMKKLMELADCDDNRLSREAFTVLMPLTAHPHSAALIGASDGVQFFYSHLESQRQHITRQDAISALSLLSREAVNRAKMRELGALTVLLDALREESLWQVQDRVISSLVNFLYDDASLGILLEEGLVSMLLHHLQRCGGFSTSPPIDFPRRAEELLHVMEADQAIPFAENLEAFYSFSRFLYEDESSQDSESDAITWQKIRSASFSAGITKLRSSSSVELSLEQAGLHRDRRGGSETQDREDKLNQEKASFTGTNEAVQEISKNQSWVQEIEGENGAASQRPSFYLATADRLVQEQDQAVSEEEFVQVESADDKSDRKDKEEETMNDACDKTKTGTCLRHVYSMDSPTYQVETNWRMEDFQPGVKRKYYDCSSCISPLSPSSYDESSRSACSPYSPLSTVSYYSPVHMSPIQSSPASSPTYACSALSPAQSWRESEAASVCWSPMSQFTGPLSPQSPVNFPLSPEWERSGSPLMIPDDRDGQKSVATLALKFSSSEDEDVESKGAVSISGETEKNGEDCSEDCEPTSLAAAPLINILDVTAGGTMESLHSNDIKITVSASRSSSPESLDKVSGKRLYSESNSLGSLQEKVELAPKRPKKQNSKNNTGMDSSEISSRVSKEQVEIGATQEMEEKGIIKKSSIQALADQSSASKTLASSKKSGPKLHRNVAQYALASQNSILILLSRLSVREDLSKHLANPRVIACLLDYLTVGDQPQDRCTRIMSRVFSNPHCLSPLLLMCAPVLLVKSLMVDPSRGFVSQKMVQEVEQSRANLRSARFNRHSPTAKKQTAGPRTSTAEVSDKNVPAPVRVEEKISVLRRRVQSDSVLQSSHLKSRSAYTSKAGQVFQAAAGKLHPSAGTDLPTSDEKDKGANSQPASSPQKMQWEELATVGCRLLGDLSMQAMTPFGDGVIGYTFFCMSEARKLVFATSLLFLQSQWSQERRQHILFNKGILEHVLSALQKKSSGSSDMKHSIVLGLVVLVHDLQPAVKYQASDRLRLLKKAAESLKPPAAGTRDMENVSEISTERAAESWTSEPECGSGKNEEGAIGSEISASQSGSAQTSDLCWYEQAEKDLHIVVGRKKGNRVLEACRETLVSVSSVFAAMLGGGYMESTQSRITIADARPEALSSLLHLLHGCSEGCSTLEMLHKHSEERGQVAVEAVVCKYKTSSKQAADKADDVFQCDMPAVGKSDAIDEDVETSGLTHSDDNSAKELKPWQQHLHSLLDSIVLADRFLLSEVVDYLSSVIITSGLLSESYAEDILHFALFHSVTSLAEESLRILLLSRRSVDGIVGCICSLMEGRHGPELAAAIRSLVRRAVSSHQ